MTELKDKVTIGLRLASMLVDHFAMTFIMMFIIMPGFVVSMFDAFNLDHEPSSFGFGGMSFLFAFGFSAYFNKDIFNGRSPAKRILKMQVIDNKTGQAANPLKCLVRNLTIPLWPLEVIFVLIDPKKRLGDRIAGTRIDYIENPEKIKLDWSKFTIALLIAIIFSILISLPFALMNSKLETDKISYVENTFDQTKSVQTNNLFETKLDGLIREADFKVYKQIENDDRKYVAGILYFNNRRDYDNFKESEMRISELLNSEFSPDHHVCFLKFVYKEPGSMSTRQKLYDSRKEKNRKASS
ncbi:RDD family protein [Marinifilum caeruleilacunae]|uniref:RDD family protein n=1 Tax=Marinifilum caeruleilacunae TaxID=2499076 RepID=A0ABX1X0Q9_9BACT|nr:RDD family protein [Marinifilum caeruleilacunae]NOU61993.1 RDD family protein [Marinifilum caeruleilacunae]